MSDNTFILVGMLTEYEKYYDGRTPDIPGGLIKSNPSNGDYYAMFVCVTDQEHLGGVHEIIAAPSTANTAWYCIQRRVPALIRGSIKSFRGKVVLLATYVTGYEPSAVTRDYFPKVTDWSLPANPDHIQDALRRIEGTLEEPSTPVNLAPAKREPLPVCAD